MKAEGNGNGVIVPDKLRQFLTNLAALLPGEKSDAKIAEKQIQLLAAAILDHGRLVSQFHSHHSVGVEERPRHNRFSSRCDARFSGMGAERVRSGLEFWDILGYKAANHPSGLLSPFSVNFSSRSVPILFCSGASQGDEDGDLC